MKRMLFLLLAAVILLASCGDADDSSSDSSLAASSEEWEGSSAAEIVISEMTSEEISLIPVDLFELNENLLFRLPAGWTAEETGMEGELVNAYSEDKLYSVNAVQTPLQNPTGLSEQLLANEMLSVLSDSWESSGAQDFHAELITVTLLGEALPAVSITATVDGRTVFQNQLYRLQADSFLTLTVTSFDAEYTALLWTYFEKSE